MTIQYTIQNHIFYACNTAKMAEVNESAVSLCDDSTLCSNSQTVKNCANCVLKDQQLQFALTKLKSAQTIISILQEDIKHRSASFSQQTTVRDAKTREDSQGNQKWETISDINTRNKKSDDPQVRKRNYSDSYCTANRYAPLSNLKVTEEDIMCMDNPVQNFTSLSDTSNSATYIIFNTNDSEWNCHP